MSWSRTDREARSSDFEQEAGAKSVAPGKLQRSGAPDGASSLAAAVQHKAERGERMEPWHMTPRLLGAMGLEPSPPVEARVAAPVQFRRSTPTAELWGGPFVQARGELAGENVVAVAQSGVAGAASQLPHLDAIQRSFGKHDVSGARAQVGGAAQEAAGALGAQAYATGDRAAFASTPDLHTAAHEAAHIIQQRAGVQLKGGVGEQGDMYERHADAVADLVVSGRSAEAMLDQLAPASGPSGAVQAKGGNLATPVLPRYRKTPSERGVVLAALPPGERDADGSNAAKLKLENDLATWVVTNAASFFDPVKALTAKVKLYLDKRAEHLAVGVAESLTALTPQPTTYGRLVADPDAYSEQLKLVLAGGGALHEHLLVQQMFVDKIYNTDVDKLKDEVAAKFADLLPEPLAKDALKPKDGAIDIGVGSTTYEKGHDDARAAAKNAAAIPKVNNGGLGPHDVATHGAGTMERGTDRFTSVEKNAFVQSARLILDMPLSGTGLSGSATDLFACGTMLGVDNKEDYALATFSFFASAGAHTFHEVMLMARAARFNAYVPGNYISAIPEARRAEVRAALPTHAAQLTDPAVGGPVPQAADEKLHGFSDVLDLDGPVAGWAAKIKAFLATRFAVEADKVIVDVINAGRSGDAVFKVDIERVDKPAFKGIFKIFHDADTADTEVLVGEKLQEAHVSTPGYHGMSRVEAKDGSASKAGVLFDRADGKAVDSLITEIGTLAKDAAERPAKVEALEHGVVAVAKELATMHGKSSTRTEGRVGAPAPINDHQMAKDVKEGHEAGLFKLHFENAKARGRFKDGAEAGHVQVAFEALLQNNLVGVKVRRSMTHGDANAGNFIVDGDSASVIDVNTTAMSLGPTGAGKKTGAADTGRFLETLRTTSPGALTPEELTRLDKLFHNAYLPGTEAYEQRRHEAHGPAYKGTEKDLLVQIDREKSADETAEVYYRACWILNQLSHAEAADLQKSLKSRLLELIPSLAGKLDPT